MFRALPLLVLLALASGCVSAPVRPAASTLTGALTPSRAVPSMDRERLMAAIESAAVQVKRCYRHPRIPTAGKRIATRLRVHFSPDGHLTGIPLVIEQSGVTEDNRSFAPRMAEAASQAVMLCAPIRLPPDLYAGGWDEIDLIFSPALLV